MTHTVRTHHRPEESTRARGRFRTTTLWLLQALTAAAFLMAALPKLAGAAQVVATFDAIGFGDWFRYLIGVLEIAGAAALLIPRLAGPAGLAFVGLTAGAALTHLIVVGGGVVMVLPFLVLSAVVAWTRRESTTQLWNLVTRR